MSTIYDPSAKPDLVTVNSPYEKSKIYKGDTTIQIEFKLDVKEGSDETIAKTTVPATRYHITGASLDIVVAQRVGGVEQALIDVPADSHCYIVVWPDDFMKNIVYASGSMYCNYKNITITGNDVTSFGTSSAISTGEKINMSSVNVLTLQEVREV